MGQTKNYHNSGINYYCLIIKALGGIPNSEVTSWQLCLSLRFA